MPARDPLSSLPENAAVPPADGATSDVQDVFLLPATPGQERFWTVDQLASGDVGLNMPLAWTVTGKLDYAIVQQALNEIVKRHEVLRTTFQFSDGRLMQVVGAEFPVPLDWEDLSGLEGDAQKDELKAAILGQARVKFDTARGPLVRAALLKVSETHHVLTVTLHHVICDGWSNGVLLRDFAHFYEDFSLDKQPSLPELPIQFADWAVWLDERLESDEFDPAIDYWKQVLTPPPPALVLPTDAPRSTRRNQPGHIESLLLDFRLCEEMRLFGHREHITLYVLMLASLELLLSKYSGQKRFLLGYPYANRSRPETENLIGLFANPQLIVADLEDLATFRDLVFRVRDSVLESYPHQELPFEKIVENLGLDRGANRLQLPVYFILQKAFMQTQKLSDIEITPLRSVSPGAQFDMMIGVVERTEGIRIQIEYNAHLYRLETIQRFLNHYRLILEAAVANPNLPLAQFLLLDDAEKAEASCRWVDASILDDPKITGIVQASLPGWRGEPLRLRLTVADADGCPCPAGVPGELALGGLPSEAKELARNPAQFADDALGGFLLRTGKRARQQPDGAIVFEDVARQEPEAASSRVVVAPRNDTEVILQKSWSNILEIDQISCDKNFFEAGATSLAALRISTRLSEMFGREIPLPVLAANPTVQKLAEYLESEGSGQPMSRVVPLQQGGSRTPIFCIYGIFLYHHFAEQFRGERPVYGVYLPEEVSLASGKAVDLSNELIGSVPLQARAYLEAIREVQPHGPYILAGESYGGVVAFEIAQQLREIGETVELVCLLDSHAPGTSHSKPLSRRLGIHAKKIGKDGLSYLKDKLEEKLKGAGTQGGQADARAAARSLAFHSYRPRPYPGPMVLFRAEERDEFESDSGENMMGWGPLAAGPFEVVSVPGDHLGILKAPNVIVLADGLRSALQPALSRK